MTEHSEREDMDCQRQNPNNEANHRPSISDTGLTSVSGKNAYADSLYVNNLRSAATTGAEYSAGFEAGRNAAVALAQRWRDEAAEFSDERAQLQRNVCQNISKAIAALPAPAGDSVTTHILARAIEPFASGYTREFHNAEMLAEKLLSTFTITRKSEARS